MQTPDQNGNGSLTSLQLSFSNENGEQHQPAFTLTPTGLRVRDDLTYEEWVDGLKFFRWAHNALEVGFSDYLAWGNIKFLKQAVDSALEQLEFDLPTVKAALDINTVPPEIRYPNLTSEHYIVLAKNCEKKNQMVKWAKTASVQSLTPGQLKASIREGEVVDTTALRQQTRGIASVHGVRQDFDIWLRRVGGVEGIRKMNDEDVSAIMEELRPMYDLYRELMRIPATP
jgi:hypothetical protein